MEELKQPNIPASNPEYMTEEQTRGLLKESLSKYDGLFRVLSGNIQSGNFVTGSTGWALNALGNIEANAGTFRGTLDAATISGSAISGGTIVGTVITTATSGDRTIFDSNNLRFYNGETQEGFMRPDSTTNLVIGSAGSIYFTNLSGTPIMNLSASGILKLEVGSSGRFAFAGGPYMEDGGSSVIFGPTNTSIRPASNGAGDCGTSSRKWNYIYAQNSGIGDIVIFDKFCPICEKELKIDEDYVFHSYKLNPEKHDGIHAVPVHLGCALKNNKEHDKIASFIEAKSIEYQEWRKIKYKKEFEEDNKTITDNA
jgi:hypothetical protein